MSLRRAGLFQHDAIQENLTCAQKLMGSQFTRWAKNKPQYRTHNFVRYWPIFKILSLSHSLGNLHNKTRYVCLPVCMLPMAGRTAGPIKTKLGIGTHVDPRSVLVKVKVKVIYLCVRYRIHDSDTWRTTMNHARSSSSSSSSSSAVAGATW